MSWYSWRQACVVALSCAISLLAHFALLRFDALKKSCEIWETYDNNAQVVHRLLFHSLHEKAINSLTATITDVLKRTLD